ncbi:hypothetical protein [Pseudobacteriovorax antillogorgiicola]|uniref:Uncharacterized protein n=1 Tax=Pseudobacteriovorax antillogorgiicola TaxID=1513793 RepID=A0A1Y6C7C9_9BACT|nr:hypothetical protein [Pseudobacteriovorax antillogorgiicola]TCS49492.1 hypothetical protein EDD56_115174 [Pseudobacteriovorax antillogorgiicola]SMF45952.1 hypothetical protein SAMN06296036_11411 [Pseudobacteriovorax antillogorgiicola]
MTISEAKKEHRSLGRKLDHIWQQISALEISLQELRSFKKISREQFNRRAAAIKNQKQKIRAMKQQLEYESKISSDAIGLGFPQFESLAPLEAGAVEDYFNGRFMTARDMYQNIAKMAPWVEDAVAGKARFKGVFRLARIRSYRNKLKDETRKVHLDIQLQRKLLKKLAQITLGPSFNSKASLTRQISDAFHGADTLRRKISSLERKISQKKQEIHYMKNWLQEARSNIRRKVPEPPPEFSSLRELNSHMEIYGIDQLNRSKERLTLASVYVHSYVKKYAQWDHLAKQGVADGD